MFPISQRFNITVRRPDGTGIANAAIHVYKNNVPVNAQLWGKDELYTDSYGVFDDPITGTPFPADSTPLVIEVLVRRYAVKVINTVAFAIYTGTYVADMEPGQAVGDYSFTTPPSRFMSPLHSIDCLATGGGDNPWELMRFTVTYLDGRSAIIDAPVDPVSNIALVDLRSRARLHPRINLVPDDQTYLADPDFSDALNVTISSVTSEGEASLGGGFITQVANMQPSGGSNDLSNYTAVGAQNRWISLLDEPIAFRGYYFDTMCWLPQIDYNEPLQQYTLTTRFFNGANVQVGNAEVVTIPASDRVYRIRLTGTLDPAVRFATLSVSNEAGEAVLRTLKVIYRG